MFLKLLNLEMTLFRLSISALSLASFELTIFSLLAFSHCCGDARPIEINMVPIKIDVMINILIV